MKKVIIYQLILLCVIIYLLTLYPRNVLPAWMANYKLPFLCALMGGIGGAVYCLRAVYLNYSLKKNWDSTWEVWYYLRPIVSVFCGVISYVFLKAGLLILESTQSSESSDLGFLALAFIAGLNVDNFIKKIESIAQSAWGIKESRTSEQKQREE